jgi:photosystem II stability/assembly factor-like uncharacterized protein
MKPVSIFSILFILFTLESTGQFEWLSPIPTGNNLTASWFVNQDEGILAGHGGDVLKTIDGGQTWVKYIFDNYPEWGYDFNSVFFTDDQTGYIAGSAGSIFKTTDAGETWVFQNGCQNCEIFEDIFFLTPELGWTVGKYGALRKTSNGGEDWVNLSGFPLDQVDLYGVWFINDQQGWAAGGGNIVRLSAGGAAWEFLSYNNTFYDVFFIDENTGWICGNAGTILLTDNAGEDWQTLQMPTEVALMEISFTDPLNGWAVGTDGTIISSYDGGQTWIQYLPVTDRTLNSIFIASEQDIYVTGEGGTIIKSENGGELWEFPQANTITDDIADIVFSDEYTGWTATYNGKIFKSTDGGHQWNLSYSYSNIEFTAITSPDAMHVWASGLYNYPWQGVILFSGNSGLDWTIQLEDIGGIYDIIFMDAMNGWAVGYNGVIYHTSDGGAQWNLQISGAQNDLNSVFFLDNQNGLAGGYDEVVQTYDGGATWEMQEVFFDDFWLIHRVYAFDPVNRIASGDLNLFYADYPGNSWNMGSQNPVGVRDVAYYTPQFLWEAGNDGLLLKRNGMWDYYSITTNDLNALYFDQPAATGYVAGDFGTIIKIDLDFWVGTDEPEKQISKFSAAIFPNPASGIADCRFSMADSRRIILKIFDVSGREMAKVFEGMKPAGEHSIHIDVSGFDPGIYFYRISSGDQSMTGKLVVAR